MPPHSIIKTRSTLEEQDGDLTRVVNVQRRLGLASHFEGETLAHDAVPVRTKLAVHSVLDTLAG